MEIFKRNRISVFRILLILISPLWISSIHACASLDLGNLVGRSVQTSSKPGFDPQRLDKIAILVEKGREIPDRMIEDEFISALLRKNYTVAARSDIQAVLKEIQFQKSVLTDDDAIKLGKVLNVQAVLIVSVTSLKVNKEKKQLECCLDARLIGVERSEVLWIGTHSGTGEVDKENKLLKKLSAQLADSIPSRGSN